MFSLRAKSQIVAFEFQNRFLIFIKEKILKVLIKRKKSVTACDVNYAYSGDYFTIYSNVKSFCCDLKVIKSYMSVISQ